MNKQQQQQQNNKAQVCMDLHAALGVKFGEDPYARINELKKLEEVTVIFTPDGFKEFANDVLQNIDHPHLTKHVSVSLYKKGVTYGVRAVVVNF
jgi:hypothetical protein